MRTRNVFATLVFLTSVGLCFVAYAQVRPQGILPLSARINGIPVPLGVIVSAAAASANNATTAAPFNNTGNALKGKVLLLSPTGSGRMLVGDADTVSTVSTEGQATTGVPLISGERVIVVMRETTGFVAWKGDSGTTSLRVWELQ